MGPGDLCRVPPAAVCHGRARQIQGRDRVVIVEWPWWYRARGVSILGKFVSSRNPGYMTRGVVMCLNVVLTPGSQPRSQISGTGPSTSCGYCCPLCPTGGAIFGENSFYRAPGSEWALKTCVGCPKQRYAKGEPGKVQGRDHVGIVEGSCGYRACEVSIRGKFDKPGVQE